MPPSVPGDPPNVSESQAYEVLYVGDDDAVAEVFRATLERENDRFSVRLARNHEGALASFDGGEVDCIVYDDGDSKQNILDSIAEVRALDSTLPVLLLTDSDADEVATEAIAAGVTDCFDRDDVDARGAVLSNRIENAIRCRRAERRSEETRTLEAVFEASPIGIAAADDDGRIRSWSPACERLFGWSVEEIRDERLSSVFEESRAEFRRLTEAILDAEAPAVGREVSCRTKDGSSVDITLTTVPLRDASGAVSGVVYLFEDVSDRKRRNTDRRRERELLERVLNTSPVGILVFDADGDVERANDRVESILGLPAPDISERSYDDPAWDIVDPTGDSIPSSELPVRRVLDTGEPVEGYEHAVRRPDGQQRLLRVDAAPLKACDGTVERVVVAMADITERRRAEEELRRKEKRYRTLTEMAPDPIVAHVDGGIVYANGAAEELFAASDSGSLPGDHISDYLAPSERDDAVEAARRTQSGEREPTRNQRTAVTGDGTVKYIETTSRPIEFEGEPAVLTVVKDVTHRHGYEQTLRALTENSRRLMLAETRSEAARVVADAGEDLLDLPGAVVYGFEDDRFVPLATSPSLREADETVGPVSHDAGGPLWDAFASGESASVGGASAGRPVSGLPFRNVLVVPVGNHGVFVTGTVDGDPLADTARELSSVLAGDLEATFDRVGKNERIRAQEHRLREQNTRLTRLNRLNEMLRSTNRALVQSTSREEMERAVCDELAASESVVGAWMGELDGGVRMTTVSGIDESHVSRVLDADESPVTELVRRVASDGSGHANRGVLGDSRWEPFRRDLLSAGYSAVVAVPIPVRGTVESVLVLHVSDGELFDETGFAVVEELGQLVGSAVETVGARSAVLTDHYVQVDLDVRDESLVFSRFARRTDRPFTMRGAVSRDDGTVVAFLTTAASPDDVRAFDDSERTADVSVLSMTDDGTTLCELRVDAELFDRLAKYDCRLQTLSGDESALSLTVDLPKSTNVRDVVDDLRARYAAVELTARRERRASVDTVGSVRTRYRDACTDRQFEAIEAAHYGGFYEWPRQSNNAALADVLGVSSPTYQAHRRAAERKLVELVFE